MLRIIARKLVFLTFLCSSSSFLAFYVFHTADRSHQGSFKHVQHTPGSGFNKSAPKILLLWGTDKQARDFGYGVDNFKRKCQTDACELVENLEQFPNADAVMFYIINISSKSYFPSSPFIKRNERLPGYPERAYRDQKFVFFHMEAPTKIKGRSFEKLRDMFNLTMTYLDHPDTDVLARHTLRTVKVLSEKQLLEAVRNKTKLVAWVVSNCKNSFSKRNLYVDSLKKYIDVDIYGRCGRPCNDTWLSRDCFVNIEKQYKFYLAFENSLCDDYITEKMYRTLSMNLVPIALNGVNNSKYLPQHSYIDTRQFASARKLAQYLYMLDANDTKYMEYFAWKKHKYPKVPKFRICQLCDILNNEQYKFKSHFNPAEYWNSTKSCKNKFLPDEWNV